MERRPLIKQQSFFFFSRFIWFPNFLFAGIFSQLEVSALFFPPFFAVCMFIPSSNAIQSFLILWLFFLNSLVPFDHAPAGAIAHLAIFFLFFLTIPYARNQKSDVD